MRRGQNGSADESAHGFRRGRSVLSRPRVSLPPEAASERPPGARPLLRRPAAPTSGYLSDSSLHNSASLSLALTIFSQSQEWDHHILFTGPAAGAASSSSSRRRRGWISSRTVLPLLSWIEGLAGGHIKGGNLSSAVMRAHSEQISLVCCQKHLERITQGYTPPPEDQRIIYISDISLLQL